MTDPHCRVCRITWRIPVPAWRLRWLYAELIAKGAVVSVWKDDWEIRW
jgi:hypothetical protein